MCKQNNPEMVFELIQQFRKYKVKCNTTFEPDNLLKVTIVTNVTPLSITRHSLLLTVCHLFFKSKRLIGI